jgi:hypothetical protein
MKNTIKRQALYLAILTTSILGISGIADAASDSAEEEACFSLLAEAAKNDSRFLYRNNKLDFSRLRKEETDSANRIDLSTYTKFRENRDCRVGNTPSFTDECKSASRRNSARVNYMFPAQRTHIATLLKGDDYAVTQYSSFGTDTNFSYPYKILDTIEGATS